MCADGDDRWPLAEARGNPRPYVLDPNLRHIPLGENDDGRALGLSRHVRDRQVLVDDSLAAVDEDECDIGPLGSLERAELE